MSTLFNLLAKAFFSALNEASAADGLTVEHGEPLQVLVGLQLLAGTQRHAERHGPDPPLDQVDVTRIQEEHKPTGSHHHCTRSFKLKALLDH